MSTVRERDASVQRPQAAFDIDAVRADFPILAREVNGHPLAYLDNAATSQTPQCVIDAIARYYRETNANVHRGVHTLSQEATAQYEGARKTIRQFINAPLPCEIVFTRGTTDAINLVAYAFGDRYVAAGDEVLITAMEHHSNIVPWQLLCERKGATLKVLPIDDAGQLCMEELDGLLTDRTRIMAVAHVSNALGTVNPVKEIIAKCHARNVPVLVDAAQSAPHLPVDVQDLNCDFLALSAHKACGPTGFGVLFGRAKYLNEMPPYQGGGDMIKSVRFEKTLYNDLPYKFEAGTPNIAGAIAFAAAIDYLNGIGMARVAAYEQELLNYGHRVLGEIEGLRMVGTARAKASVISFTLDAAHPHDIGQILDDDGVAIRAGHHCAQPVMERYGLAATARASFAFYNTPDEIDALARAIRKVNEIFA